MIACASCGKTLPDERLPTKGTTTGAGLTAQQYESALMESMTASQRTLFQAEMMQARKDSGAAILLALLLGGLGAHRFYLKDTLGGFIYLAFCWTFVPMVISLIEAIFISQRVDRYNKQQAYLIAARIRAYSSAAASTPS